MPLPTDTEKQHYYDVLRLKPDASTYEINEAYQEQFDLYKENQKKLQSIQEAYIALSELNILKHNNQLRNSPALTPIPTVPAQEPIPAELYKENHKNLQLIQEAPNFKVLSELNMLDNNNQLKNNPALTPTPPAPAPAPALVPIVKKIQVFDPSESDPAKRLKEVEVVEITPFSKTPSPFKK